MKSIATCLKSLETSNYLRTMSINEQGLPVVELMPHGITYGAQLVRQWLNARSDSTYLEKQVTSAQLENINGAVPQRLNFIHSKEFKDNIEHLKKQNVAKCPSVMRYKQKSKQSIPLNILEYSKPTTHLISDFFISSRRGLEHFYSIQRESKIWWMRYTTNPNRCCIEPYDLSNEIECTKQVNHCQSIDIKMRFPDGIATVEHITFVPLANMDLTNPQSYQFLDKSSHEMVLPTVIRSVIQLETAVCAMLLDGCIHKRENTLMLNRKLAPQQCAIVCVENENSKLDGELRDLCAHFRHVLHRAGIRLGKNKSDVIYVESKNELQNHIEQMDCVGVPYALLIDQETLRSGLCKLRCRDTTLAETIHISDLPIYLMNIFMH